jgi:hypothetical protein
MTLLKDLIDIPTASGADDFVVKLTDARTRAAETLRDYVPTEAVVGRLNDAFGRVEEAFQQRRSLATYLHGSFGSGKSHFMAVMTLLLEGAPEAFAKSEMAALTTKNSWLGERKVLVLGFHMLGAKSIEHRVLGDYLRQVRQKRPEAPNVSVYRSDNILESAQNLREQLGDAEFFGKLGGGNTGWGDYAQGWDAEQFERAIAADENDEERLALVAALLDLPTFRPFVELFASDSDQFVAFDEGLRRIARHAKDLGYECIVLCLDELILWLAQHATEQAFLNREVEKLVQLVESNVGDRDLPIVSFVARQRNLAELIKTSLPSFNGSQIYEKLQHHEARFGSPIELPDSDLATIAERRLLSPKDTAAKAKIDAAFQHSQAMRADALQALGSTSSMADFRKVYPFTPAVVDVLVAASGLLQRDRTALKVMRELLVAHRDTLELESVVPMGDLFDQLSVGQLAIDELFRIRFERARRLWSERIAPSLERKYRVHPDAARSAAAQGSKEARACLGISRLVKTLLLANVVEARKVLADLDLRRAVHLNHGSIRAPVPNGEAAVALAALRELATEIPEIKITEGAAGNPFVSVVPTDHDLGSIVQSAAEFESQAGKVRALRKMFLDALGLDEAAVADRLQPFHDCKIEWRRTTRPYQVMFTNIATLSGADLANDADTWRIIVGLPLADASSASGPTGAELIAQFLRDGKKARTVVWTPRTFGEALQRDLGKLVRVEALLRSDENFSRHTQHVPGPDRESVRGSLRQLNSSLEARIGDALRSAYGLTGCIGGVVDDVAPDRFLQSLDPAFVPLMPVATSLDDAMRSLVDKALAAQFPDHPVFEGSGLIGRAALEKVLDCCRRGVADPTRRIEPDATERPLMWQIARQLGLVQMTGTDSAAVLLGSIFEHLDRVRLQKGGGDIRVADLRSALDHPRPRGLTRDMQDLLLLLYADLMRLRCLHYGQPRNEVRIGQLDNESTLRQMPLPDEAEWKRAVKVMNAVFGSGLGQVLTVHSFGRLNDEVVRKRGEFGAAVRELHERLSTEPIAALAPAEGARRKTAETAHRLLKAMEGDDELPRIARIAGFEGVPLAAFAKSIASATRVTETLRSTHWAVFKMIAQVHAAKKDAAQVILAKARHCLTVDEADAAISESLRGAVEEANRLMLTTSAASPPGPTPKVGPSGGGSPVDRGEVFKATAAAVADDLDRLSQALAANPKRRVNLTWEVFEE